MRLRCWDGSASKLHDIFLWKEGNWHLETLTHGWAFQRQKEHRKNTVAAIIFPRKKKTDGRNWHLLL